MSKKYFVLFFLTAVLALSVAALALAEATPAPKAPVGSKTPLPTGAKTTDPVCGMEMTVADDSVHLLHEGVHYYFCSEQCRMDFKKNPDKYLKPPAKK